MLRSVPTGISCLLGTITVSTTDPECRANFTWLPFWLTSAKPAACRRRLTSRKGSGSSRPNLNLDKSNVGRARGLWWLEVEFQSLLEIGQCFSLVFALARDIQLKALSNVPIAFPPNARSKWTLHGFILPLNSVFGQLGLRGVAQATVEPGRPVYSRRSKDAGGQGSPQRIQR